MRAIEMVVMGLLGFVVLLMVVRPLVRRILAPDEGAVPALPAGSGAAAATMAPQATREPPRRQPA